VTSYDPRVTAARADLADARLKGKIAAPRYARGGMRVVMRGAADLRKEPASDASLHTQLLYGERFRVFEEKSGWAWGQAELDNYVGYVRASSLSRAMAAPTHRVTSMATPSLPGPDVKHGARDLLPMNAKLTLTNHEGRFALLSDGNFVFAGHLSRITTVEEDWVAVAERFLGTPYLWGGKTLAGIDCSGLIQTSLEAAGKSAPRDTDMMEGALGRLLSLAPDLSGLKRGDLIFWPRHIGVMQDATRLLHANAWFMEVTSETLAVAAARIAEIEGKIRTVKRLD
jgi:cell wall-associated NlpC family hydrolase